MDILVVTPSDFALVRRGRPVAAGRWHDVRAAHATVAGPAGDSLCVVLRLPAGAFHACDHAPGWDEFLEAAEAALPGMRPRTEWERELRSGAPGHEVPVYTSVT